mmetsp:Transcript_45222/g.90309  ORF Transcript_45222/g.90309 Transcript_45222/m.90309 type:complete len:307 (+) Transcript_45222:885-1805(+)
MSWQDGIPLPWEGRPREYHRAYTFDASELCLFRSHSVAHLHGASLQPLGCSCPPQRLVVTCRVCPSYVVIDALTKNRCSPLEARHGGGCGTVVAGEEVGDVIGLKIEELKPTMMQPVEAPFKMKGRRRAITDLRRNEERGRVCNLRLTTRILHVGGPDDTGMADPMHARVDIVCYFDGREVRVAYNLDDIRPGYVHVPEGPPDGRVKQAGPGEQPAGSYARLVVLKRLTRLADRIQLVNVFEGHPSTIEIAGRHELPEHVSAVLADGQVPHGVGHGPLEHRLLLYLELEACSVLCAGRLAVGPLLM